MILAFSHGSRFCQSTTGDTKVEPNARLPHRLQRSGAIYLGDTSQRCRLVYVCCQTDTLALPMFSVMHGARPAPCPEPCQILARVRLRLCPTLGRRCTTAEANLTVTLVTKWRYPCRGHLCCNNTDPSSDSGSYQTMWEHRGASEDGAGGERPCQRRDAHTGRSTCSVSRWTARCSSGPGIAAQRSG